MEEQYQKNLEALVKARTEQLRDALAKQEKLLSTIAAIKEILAQVEQ